MVMVQAITILVLYEVFWSKYDHSNSGNEGY